ncbi:MAG: HEAT repeat domain-containing protein, partial [Solirubrobacteraceae bacterium]|nr:HEAT repeat domain-containing protein [Solirubrobacteraceae bacterium]
MALSRRTPIERAERALRKRDLVTTREGWVVDLAAGDRIAAVDQLVALGATPDGVAVALDDDLDDVRAAGVLGLARLDAAAAAERCATHAPAWPVERFPRARSEAWRVVREQGEPRTGVRLAAALRVAGVAPDFADALRALDEALGHDEAARDEALTAALDDLERNGSGTDSVAWELVARLGRWDPALLEGRLTRDPGGASVAAALGVIGSLSSVAPLAAVLAANRPGAIRSAAVRALGQVGGRDAAAALAVHVDDPDPDVRRAVLAALAPLTAAFGPAAPGLPALPAPSSANGHAPDDAEEAIVDAEPVDDEVAGAVAELDAIAEPELEP